MIYDCSMFNREFDILKMRVEILSPFIDKFVVVQADMTHDFQPREFVDLSGFSDDIIDVHLKMARDKGSTRWTMDNRQRMGIHKGLGALNPSDWVIVSDIDEIPDMGTWNGQEGVFQQRHSYYKFDLVDPRPWNGSCIIRGWRFNNRFGNMTVQDVRNFRDLLKPCGVGWHFGWLSKDLPEALKKMGNCAHDELNGEVVSANYGKKHPMDGVELIHSEQYLPKVVYDYPQYFTGAK